MGKSQHSVLAGRVDARLSYLAGGASKRFSDNNKYYSTKSGGEAMRMKRNAAMKRHYAQKRAAIVSHNVNWGRSYVTEANKRDGCATYESFPTHTSTFTARTSELDNVDNLCDHKNINPTSATSIVLRVADVDSEALKDVSPVEDNFNEKQLNAIAIWEATTGVQVEDLGDDDDAITEVAEWLWLTTKAPNSYFLSLWPDCEE